MKILITGTEGYIGARMAPILAARGHDITGLDTGFYRDGCLYLDPIGMAYGATHDFQGFAHSRATGLRGLRCRRAPRRTVE